MQSIKQLTDGLSVYGLYELFVHLSVCVVRGSADDLLSKWKKDLIPSFLFFLWRTSPFNINSSWVLAVEIFKFISFDDSDWYLYKNGLFIS
jgi:hypothetical protein